jgi:hypothetical protein
METTKIIIDTDILIDLLRNNKETVAFVVTLEESSNHNRNQRFRVELRRTQIQTNPEKLTSNQETSKPTCYFAR